MSEKEPTMNSIHYLQASGKRLSDFVPGFTGADHLVRVAEGREPRNQYGHGGYGIFRGDPANLEGHFIPDALHPVAGGLGTYHHLIEAAKLALETDGHAYVHCVGWILVVPAEHAKELLERLRGWDVYAREPREALAG